MRRPVDAEGDSQMKMHLIPNDQLLIISKSALRVYNLTPIKSGNFGRRFLEPSWRLPPVLRLFYRQYIYPVITPHCTRITFITSRSKIVCMAIPHDPTAQPELDVVVNEAERSYAYRSGAMGYSNAIFLDWRSHVSILQYPWDNPFKGCWRTLDHGFSLPSSEFNVAVDRIVGLSEERGRMVLQTDKHTLAVLDLFPPSSP